MKIQYETELYHHGIKGQKWYVRRFQNADGSYTAAGRKRYSKELTKQYNEASVGVAGSTYRYHDAKEQARVQSERAQRRQSSDSRVVRFIGKLNSKASARLEKNANFEAAEADRYAKLAEHALNSAGEAGFTSDFYRAWRAIDRKEYYDYSKVTYQMLSQVKITDPTQPKTREERRAEKDLNRVKNAAYEENQSLQRLREATTNAEQTVGTRPVKGYRLQREWNNPEHEDVKKAKQAERSWMRSQERFADEYDRYKKRHPGTDKSLRDFAKMRERNMYPVKKKYRT